MIKDQGVGGSFVSIEHISVEELNPYSGNSRTHSKEQITEVARSIEEFGFCNPVLIDSKNVIIAGHCRVLAAKKLEMLKVPCLRLSHLSEDQRRAYVIADNRIAANAGWNEELLKLEIELLENSDFDLTILGFDSSELSKLLEIEDKNLDVEPKLDNLEDLQVEWDTKTGQVWQLGDHRLMCGDSENAEHVAFLLNGATPQLMVTDPPYGVNYDPSWRTTAGINNSGRLGKVENDDRADWTNAWRLFGGSIAYVWHGGLHSATVMNSLESAGFVIRGQIVWVKPRLVMSRGHYHWQHEPCWVATAEEDSDDELPEADFAWYSIRKNSTAKWDGGRKQTSVWQISCSEEISTEHGTQKPIECMARPIRNHKCSENGVYEPFSGSGTTIMACEKLRKICYAMEIDPKYIAVALQRYVDATGKSPLLIGSLK